MGSKALKRRVLREETRCRFCGDSRRFALTVDHLVPTTRGGKHTRKNLGTACIRCNFIKGEQTEIEFKIRIARDGTPWTSDSWCKENSQSGLLKCERRQMREVRRALCWREFGRLIKNDKRKKKLLTTRTG